MAAAEVLGITAGEGEDGFGDAVVEGVERGAEQIVENGTRVGARDAVDGVEVEVEVGAAEERGDAREVEDALQNPDVVLRGGDDLHDEGAVGDGVGQRGDLVDGDFGKLRHLQLADLQRLGVDAVGDVLRSGGSVLAVESGVRGGGRNELYTEIGVQTTRIVAGSEDEASVGNSVLTGSRNEKGAE